MSITIQNKRSLFEWMGSRTHKLGLWIQRQLGEKEQKSSIASLDGVRAIAALIVLGFHINLITRDTYLWKPTSDPLYAAMALMGASGVTLFFVLSGFLLFMPYVKSLLFDSDWPSIRTFYLRRVLRILPAYYAALFLMILLWHPEYLHPDHLQKLALFLTFQMDLPQVFQQINGPFWTLAVESQFYLLLPLLAFVIRLIVRHGSLKWRIPALIGCLFAVIWWGIYSRYWAQYYLTHPSQTFLVPRWVINNALPWLYGVQGKFLEDFSVGMLLCLCYVLWQRNSAEHPFNVGLRRLSPWLWRAGILGLVFTAMVHYSSQYHSWPFLQNFYLLFSFYGEIWYATGFGLCIAAILFGPVAFRRPFEWKPLRWLGLVSYSFYMWHLPLLILVMRSIGYSLQYGNHYLGYSLYWLWALVVIVPFSFFFFLLFEKPWMKLGDRLLKRTKQQTREPAPVSTPAPQEDARLVGAAQSK